jgi:hypothetical protein
MTETTAWTKKTSHLFIIFPFDGGGVGRQDIFWLATLNKINIK